MPSLDGLNTLGFILAAWCFHITRQRLAWIIRGGGINVFDIKEGESLELMEFKFPFKVLLSEKIRMWYLLNRLASIFAINFFFWTARDIFHLFAAAN
jgi:hypothetical protein